MDTIDALFTANGTGTSVGLNVGSGKTLSVAGTASISGTLVVPTSTSPAQTTDGSVVWDSDDNLLTVGTGAARKVMVDTDSTQTLTNKTLTSPAVSGGTIDNASVGGTTPAAGAFTSLSATTFTGAWASIPAGTKMLFQQTNAPVGWTKDTTHNNKALRIVSGAASSGGTVAFTTAFASQSVSGTVGNTTLTTDQIPLHGHSFRVNTSGQTSFTLASTGSILLTTGSATNRSAFTGTPSDSAGEQIGGTGGGNSHTHTFTGTAIDLAVQYVDLIIATKD
jgi:microcystin-dependent protein